MPQQSLTESQLSEPTDQERLPTDLPLVLIDADEIQQNLLNLLLNASYAIRSSKPSGTITVSAWLESEPRRVTGTNVRVRVEDDGPGVAEAVRPKIFEPFFTTKAEGQGTGLGLSVSRGIVAAHGGKLWHEPAPGGGAAFLMDLPVAPAI